MGDKEVKRYRGNIYCPYDGKVIPKPWSDHIRMDYVKTPPYHDREYFCSFRCLRLWMAWALKEGLL